jgi:hypothetical protein
MVRYGTGGYDAHNRQRAEISFHRTVRVRVRVSEQDLSAADGGKVLSIDPTSISETEDWSTRGKQHRKLPLLRAPSSIEIHFSRPFPGQRYSILAGHVLLSAQ